MLRLRFLFGEVIFDFSGKFGTNNLRDLFFSCELYTLHRSERLQKFGGALFPDSLNEIELGLEDSLGTESAVVRDGESMSFITDLLKQFQTR